MTELAPYTLEVTPLSAAGFTPFGHVIGGEGRVEPASDPRTTVPFSQWGETPIETRDGVPFVLDVVSRTVTPPLEVTRLYRHDTAPQVLASLGGAPYLIVVAPAGTTFEQAADLDELRCFVSDGSVAISIGIGVWHEGAYPLTGTIDLLNLQGANHPDDTAMVELDRLLGVTVQVRL
jgi:ureidoglycolate lyase